MGGLCVNRLDNLEYDERIHNQLADGHRKHMSFLQAENTILRIVFSAYLLMTDKHWFFIPLPCFYCPIPVSAWHIEIRFPFSVEKYVFYKMSFLPKSRAFQQVD